MKNLESLNAKKFQMLTVQESAAIQGGAFFPKHGTEKYGWCTLPGGSSGQYAADWRTGWRSDVKEYGDAYLCATD